LICPTCGERNPERARFCLRCGAALGAAAARDEERKIVTVLFCDLVGFTARSDRADPEDVKATLRPYHAAIKRILEGFGGTLDKFVGDGVLGIFGAPTAHEDDAERAIRAAFRIQNEIARLNEGSARPALEVRIGIDTGEAVVAVGPGPQVGERVTGEVVTLATRLEAVAPVGGIAVGEATRRGAADRFEYVAIETAAGAAAWMPSEISRLVREQPNTPFVGRSEEAALLRATYRRCAGEPSVQLVTVLGEPGVGKSRLIQEFAEDLDAQPDLIRWRQGRCLPYGDGVGYWPLSEIVKAEAGILESDGPEDAQAKLARSVETGVDDPTERDWLVARLAPLAGIGEVASSSDRTETFTAWRRYFEALASQHGLVLVFEDLHWGDDALLAFVEHLVDRTSGLPMLIVCAARPELYDRWPGWGGGKKNASTIALAPLSDPETAMLISGLLDRAVLPAETQRALLERAGGNPLYTEEFVRMLTDRGILERTGHTVRLSAAEIPVPDTVQAIIGARLDTLAHETKAIVQDASVLGRVFWVGALAEMGGRERADVRERLHACAKLELIRPVRSSSIEGDEEYAFWHILVRDVAYAQMPRAERAEKHRAAAEWLRDVAGSRIGDRAEVLAHHFGEAYGFALASGAPDVDELRELTVRHLLLAGERAARVDASSAERHLRRAVELSPVGDASRPPALIRLADVETSTGRFVDARDRYDEAIGILERAGDRLSLGDAMAMKTRALHRLGDMPEGERLLERAIAILEREPPGPELARAYSRMAGHQLMVARFDRCRDYAERALALAERFHLEEEIVRARQNLGAARCELGDAGGLADLWAALRQGLEMGIGVGTAVSYGNLAYQLWLLDGPAISLQVWDSAVEFSRIRGFASELHWNKCGQMEVLFDLGRWDELNDRALEVEAWDTEEGGGQLRTFAAFSRAKVLTERGDLQAAVLLEEEFLPRVRILQRPEFIAPALSLSASLEHRRGHDSMAAALIDEYIAATEDHDGFRLQFLPDVARVLAALGEVDRLEALVRARHRIRNVRTEIALETCHAILAEARDERRRAAGAYADVARRWLRYGSIPERALALLGEGRCLRHLGEQDADDRLRMARDLFASLGASNAVEGTDAVLGASGATAVRAGDA
jgi:class 3 adenylate cyclase/tetratricopeptide (TPR) repeat protein